MSQSQTALNRDPVDVLHAEILRFPGGIEAAARVIGRSPGHLRNKFSQETDNYHVTVYEALALAALVPGTEFPAAVAERFDGVFFRLPTGTQGDEDVFGSFLELSNKVGALGVELTDARRDGVIDVDEYAALELRGRRVIAAILRLLADIKTGVREILPATPAQPAGNVTAMRG